MHTPSFAGASRRLARLAGILVICLVGLQPSSHAASQAAVTIGQYELISDVPVSRNVHELTYRATLTNRGLAVKTDCA